MLNPRYLLVPLILVGCKQESSRVFVDLDLVAKSQSTFASSSQPKADLSTTNSPSQKVIPGEAERLVENLRADEKAAIRQEVEKETNEAIATISESLQDYYSREIDDFYKAEFAKIQPFKQALLVKSMQEARTIFEESAKLRGPLLTKLTLLTEFPPPEDLIPIEGKNNSQYEVKRRLEIRSIQQEIIRLDKEYKLAIMDIDTSDNNKIIQESNRILAVIAMKQTEIDDRAAKEASSLVKRFSNSLSQRIFSRYTFQLKEIPTKTVNFPKMAAQSGIPRVTFDRNQLTRNERSELTKELEAFLSLKHYQRALEASGAKDVTKEFIEWRTNLKSGHWESLQKSSAQN